MVHCYAKVSAINQDETHHNAGSTSSVTLHASSNTEEIHSDNNMALRSAWTEVERENNDPTLDCAIDVSLYQDQQPQQLQQQRNHILEEPHGDSVPRKWGRSWRISNPFLSLPSSSTASSSYVLVAGVPPPSTSASSSTRRIPHSATSDGVFANISAKPEVESQKDNEEHPPTYDSAAQDITPPYFEMAVDDSSEVFPNEVLVEGIPVGSIFQFLWNVAVAVSFQLFGVLLTYLLHTSHASKAGSMVGLGITLLNFGIRMRGGLAMLGDDGNSLDAGRTASPAGEIMQVDKPLPADISAGYVGVSDSRYGSSADSGQMDWLEVETESRWVSLILMVIGWMVIVKALAEYAAAKRMARIASFVEE